MAIWNSLETCANDLNLATQSLLDTCQRDAATNPSTLFSTTETPSEVNRARNKVLSSVLQLQAVLAEPTDFIQHLASQVQLVACLQWLGEFQVLACIPLAGNVPTKDVAELAGVPEGTLCRIVRMTATAGFLCEPQPGYVAHTPLSSPFVVKPSYLDAAMFLAETAAPTALRMSAATQRHGSSERPSETAYTVAFNTSQTFQSACEQRLKLQRQWPAFLRCAGDIDDGLAELLGRLDWHSLGNACIVDVDAQSTRNASLLAELYPGLNFVVQMSEPNPQSQKSKQPRITVQKRARGSPQTVKNAAVYILGPRLPGPGIAFNVLRQRFLSELRAHLSVLRQNPSATLILAPRVQPESGAVDADVEMEACLRDLSLLQLSNEREMEMNELLEAINSVQDSTGRLVVVNKLVSRNSATIALDIKYQPYGARHQSGSHL